jgi:DNA ligase-1
MARFHSKKAKGKVSMCAFDILYLRGANVMRLPLKMLLELLEKELEETEYYSRMRVMNGSAVQFFELVKAVGLEGIILKKKDNETSSRCEPGSKGIRSWSWQKVINYNVSIMC